MEDWVSALGEYARSALPPVEGRVIVTGLRDEVEILTDRWGVPHVYASNADDAYAAQGWLHATHRLWQFDFTRRLVQGRIAEIAGEPGLPTDRFFRTLGGLRLVRKLARTLDDASRRIGRAYHAGFLAGARGVAKPVEYQLLGVEPELPETEEEALLDFVSVSLLMAISLSHNWHMELLRAEIARRLGPEAARTLAPFTGGESPAAVPQSASFPGLVRDLTDAAIGAGTAGPGRGSNNWVVAGAKSTTGAPLLANDPHLPAQMPSIWYEVHLSCPEMDVTGVSLVGVPGVIIGHNRRIAWGLTDSWADVEDLYLEKLSDDGERYLFKGKWRRVKRVREKISVRGESKPRVHEVRLTRHGPLINSVIEGTLDPHVREAVTDAPLALRWTHYDLPIQMSGLAALNRAASWAEFRAAVRAWPVASFNVVYGDADGNIGYQMVGTIPVRPRGSGAAPLPGWTGEHEWRGTIPFEELPSVLNPAQGFLATANHRVIDADYPYYISNDFEPPARIRRIVELLTAKEQMSHRDFGRIQADTYSSVGAELVPVFLEARVSDGRTAEAFKQVETWDRRLDPDSVGGAVFNVWLYKVSEILFREKLGDLVFDSYHRLKSLGLAWAYDALRDILRTPEARWVGGDGSDNVAARRDLLGRALEEACADLEGRLGPDVTAWRWGSLHTIHFRHALARAIPPLDELLSAGPFEAPGGDDTVNRGVFTPGEGYGSGGIASWRQIVDLGDFDRSLAVNSVGQSGNPASPHHHDQCEMWLRSDYHPTPYSREKVEELAEARLTLSPA